MTTDEKTEDQIRIETGQIQSFEIQTDEHPGGHIESYGCDIRLFEHDIVFDGRGRSPQLAAENALQQYCASVDKPDRYAEDQIEAAIADLDDSEKAAEEFETGCFAEFCKAEGLNLDILAGEQLAIAEGEFQDQLDEPVALSAAILIRFGYPDTREEALARHLKTPADDVTEESYGDNNYSAGGLEEYLILTDEEADQQAGDYIRESIWSFNGQFLADYMPGELTGDDIDAMRGDRCEDANSMMIALVEAGQGMDALIEGAIAADGRGHFLGQYDGDESEIIGPDGETFYVYRTN